MIKKLLKKVEQRFCKHQWISPYVANIKERKRTCLNCNKEEFPFINFPKLTRFPRHSLEQYLINEYGHKRIPGIEFETTCQKIRDQVTANGFGNAYKVTISFVEIRNHKDYFIKKIEIKKLFNATK